MSTISRTQVVWDGLPKGLGYSNFYHLAATDSKGKLLTFWSTVAQYLPPSVHLTIPGEGDTFDDATGALTGTWSEAVAPSVITGGGQATYAGPVGAVVDWKTAGINRGHKVRGRTFIVPMSTNCFQADGTLIDSVRATLLTAGQALLTDFGSTIGVWSRPRLKTGGLWLPMTSVAVPDLAAVLRSRRD